MSGSTALRTAFPLLVLTAGTLSVMALPASPARILAPFLACLLAIAWAVGVYGDRRRSPSPAGRGARPGPLRSDPQPGAPPQEIAAAVSTDLVTVSASAAALDEAASQFCQARMGLTAALGHSDAAMERLAEQVETMAEDAVCGVTLLRSSADATLALADAARGAGEHMAGIEARSAQLSRLVAQLRAGAESDGGQSPHQAAALAELASVVEGLRQASEVAVQDVRSVVSFTTALEGRIATIEENLAAQARGLAELARAATNMQAGRHAVHTELLRLQREGARMETELLRIREGADRLPGRAQAVLRLLAPPEEVSPSL